MSVDFASDRTPAPWLILVGAIALLCAGCGGQGALELTLADPAGHNLRTVVDSEPARQLLVTMLAAEPGATPPATADAPSSIPVSFTKPGEAEANGGPAPIPTQEELRELGVAVSVDFAALSFARAIAADDKSRAVQAAFERALADGPARSEEILRQPGAFPYTVLFAPGWLYRGHPGSGADFARQRALLDRLGVENHLIQTAESGSTEDNAQIIANAVHDAACSHDNLIVVSTSKAGPEVALALSRLVPPEDAASVLGWVNAGGALRGSPLADVAMRAPLSWIVRLTFAFTRWDRAGVTSMATGVSRQRLAGADLPPSISVINLVAIPVSGSVRRQVWGGYRVLRKRGPNDGVVLLADTIWPGGANLVSLGSDHLLAEFHQDDRGLAFLRAVHDTFSDPTIARARKPAQSCAAARN